MNGPEPGATVDAMREMERDGAIVVQGNTDIAVADADYAAAFPWMLESACPDAITRRRASGPTTRSTTSSSPGCAGCPAERRVRIGDDLVLVTHASPGSQTQGFDRDLDPSTIARAHVPHRRARDLLRPHPHPRRARVRLEGHRQRRQRRLRLRRRPDRLLGARDARRRPAATATRRRRRRADDHAEIRRAEYDVLAVSNAISARGLPGDVYRAATVRTGKLVR